MSKLIRVLTLGTILATAILASSTAVAYAKDGSAGSALHQDVRRPPTERQVGETWRHSQLAADQHTSTSHTQRPPTEGQVGEAWHPRVSAPARPAEPHGQPGWQVASLGALAAAILLSVGLAVLAAKRVGRRLRVGQTV